MKQHRIQILLTGIMIFMISCSSKTDPPQTSASPETTVATVTKTLIPTEPPTPIPTTLKPTGTVASEPSATSSFTPEPTTTVSSNPGLFLSLETGLDGLTSLTFSNDGRYLAASDQNGTLSVWDISTGDNLFEIAVDGLLMVLFSPDGEFLATISNDWVELWQTKDGSLVADYLCTNELEMKFQFTPFGDLAITGILDEEQVNLTYLPANEQKNFFSENVDAWIKEATLSPDGKVIALGRSDGVIELQDANNGNLIWMNEAHSDWVLNLAFSPDSQLLVSDSFSFDPSIKVWLVKDGDLVSIPEKEKWDAGRPAFSPDGSLLTSYSSYGTKIWRTDDWSLYAQRSSFVRFSPDGVLFAEPDDMGASIWHVESAKAVDSFSPVGLRDVAFLPIDPLPLVALGMMDGSVEIHQIELDGKTTQVLATATPPSAQDIYALIDSAYGEILGDQYIEWDESMQVFLLHGFAGDEINFDSQPILTKQGDFLGSAIATVQLFNLHQGNLNSVTIPLAIELPDGTLFMPGSGDPIPKQQKDEFLAHLREDQSIGRSITILIAPEVEVTQESMGMPDLPWQNNLLIAYQDSWETELDQMLKTGQAVNVNEQELFLIPFLVWFDLFDPVPVP